MGQDFLEGESKTGFLASLWSLVTMITAISFLTAFIYALSTSDEDNYNNNQGSQDETEAEVAVTSRALAFSALWAGVLATLLSVFGTVILGYKSPTGLYYTCCTSSVHQTTPLGIGSFIGALLMFANLTLVCSVLFGEFHIRDNNHEGEDRGGGANDFGRRETKSTAFSVMCIILTILYSGFAALTMAYADDVIEECATDEQDDDDIMLTSTRNKANRYNSAYDGTAYDGYIGERFAMGRPRNGPGSFAGSPTSLA